MRFLVRVVVASAILIAFYLVREVHVVSETAAVAVCAFGLAELTAWLFDKRRVAGAIVAAVLACGAIGGATAYWFKVHPAPIPYREVEAVMADPEHWVGQTMKLHGYIELGSLSTRGPEHEQQQPVHLFVIHTKHKRVSARLTGPVPDTFADRAEVVATGTLAHADHDGYRFEATEVMSKCPSTYQTATGPQPASKFR